MPLQVDDGFIEESEDKFLGIKLSFKFFLLPILFLLQMEKYDIRSLKWSYLVKDRCEGDGAQSEGYWNKTWNHGGKKACMSNNGFK